MFSRLIKPKWQHKDPAVRKSAVTRLAASKDDDLAILNRMAVEDVDVDVRCAAISRLDNMLQLKSIAESDVSEQAVKAVHARLSDLFLTKGKDRPALAERIALLRELGDSSLAESIIEHAEELDLQIAAVECTTNQSMLSAVSLNGRSAALRQAAARQIDDQELLLELAKSSQHHDKNVYRIARQKLSTIREKVNESIQNHSHKEHLLAALEALSRCAYSALYAGKYHHLKNQWGMLGDPDSINLDQRFEAADFVCRQTISVHEAQELEKQQHLEQDRVSHEERVDLCHSVEEMLHNLMHSSHADDASTNELSTDELQKWLKSCGARWTSSMAASLPMQQEQKRFDSAIRALADFISSLQRYDAQAEQMDRLLQQVATLLNKENPQQSERLQQTKAAMERMLRQIAWPETIPPSVNLIQANKALERLDSAILASNDHQKQTLKNIDTKLQQLSGYIDAGNVKSATGLMGEVRGLLHQLGSRKTASIGNRFSELSNKLNELNDWKSFAATPKKEKLITKMEHLVESDLPLQDRANLIKELQVEWKSLGSGGKTRAESDALWHKFKLAADAAYEPCKEYFSVQRLQRKENLQQRKIICDELEHFIDATDWDEIDWKAVEKIVHLSHDEWRKYSSVERSSARQVQQRFDQLIGKINEKLKLERQANAQLKQDLVTQAEVLIDNEDLRTAINTAKRLQKEWGQIGITHRSDDRRLWKTFRSACDQIFERRTQQSQEREHERLEQLKLAEALCEKLEQATEVALSDWDDSAVHIDELAGAFNGLGPLPGESRSTVGKRFDDAVRKFKKRSEDYAKDRQQKKAQQARQLSEHCAEIEHELISGNLEATETGIERLRAELAESSLEDSFLDAIKSRVDQVVDGKGNAGNLSGQLDDNLDKLRMLCIRLEVLTHAESPEEDQELRMAYQVDRLAEGMTLASEASASVMEQLAGLTVEWLTTGPVTRDAKSELQKRWDSVMGNYSILTRISHQTNRMDGKY